jgi:PPOX class probable F420-dependent enzyme
VAVTRTSDQIAALLARPNHAIVGTNRSSGAPQLSVVWYLWDGSAFSFSTTRERAKYRNLVRDPALSLLVDAPDEGWYALAIGRAEIIPQTPAFTRQLFAKYQPTVAYDGQVAAEQVVVVLRPDKLITGS